MSSFIQLKYGSISFTGVKLKKLERFRDILFKLLIWGKVISEKNNVGNRKLNRNLIHEFAIFILGL